MKYLANKVSLTTWLPYQASWALFQGLQVKPNSKPKGLVLFSAALCGSLLPRPLSPCGGRVLSTRTVSSPEKAKVLKFN